MGIKVSAFQTIQTKYVSPTNFKGARISAKSASGIKIVRSYDYGLSVDENHAKVVQELREKLKWVGNGYGDLIGGQQANGDYVWILTGTMKTVNEPKYFCEVCGVDGANHGHYSVRDAGTHKFIAKEVN